MLVSWSFHIVSALNTEQISGLYFFQICLREEFELISPVQSLVECRQAPHPIRVCPGRRGAIVISQHLSVSYVFLSQFLRSGVPCRQPVRSKVRCSQCYIWSGSALVASGIMLLISAFFFFCCGNPAYGVDSYQKPIQAASHRLHIFHPSGALPNTIPQIMSPTLA